MEEVISSEKSWRGMRRAMGEFNSRFRPQEDATGDYFDLKRPRIQYPAEFYQDPHYTPPDPQDPFKHLGRIGYTRNTYTFKGNPKNDHNTYGSQHMKKTLWLEEMRRRIIAEKVGISPQVDETSIAETGGAYYLNTRSREKKNKYLTSRASPVPLVWNSRPARESYSLGVNISKTS